jgi:hypothetical protein
MRSVQSRPFKGRRPATCFAALGAVFGLSGCALGGSTHDLGAPVEAFSTYSFRVTRPGLISNPEGLRLRGAVCQRRLDVPSPKGLRIEHLGASGRFLEATSVKLARLDGRPIHCVFYDEQTAWKLAGGDAIRVCLDRGAADAVSGPLCTPAT